MRSKIIVAFILFCIAGLQALQVIHENNEYRLTSEEFSQFTQRSFTTQREKDSEAKKDNWEGITVLSILAEFNIEEYDELKFTSDDNYIVRIKKADILKHNPILAFKRNGKELPPEKIRLVIPGMRDMFWIQGVVYIEILNSNKMQFPHTLFIAENILSKKDLQTELEPFIDVSGYRFQQLIEDIFPLMQEEILVVGKDSVQHFLDYQKYLKNAVLVANEGSFNLQSPDMPAGMWIKNIAYVQQFDRAVFFKSHFKDISQVTLLLDWHDIPAKITIITVNKRQEINSNTGFNNSKWEEVECIKW
jgi:hypothetical protein